MERASHPSRVQLEYLIDFLERNPNLAKGFSKVPSARDTARRSWESLALELNSLGGCNKTWKQWTKYWSDKKSATKKKSAQRYRARNKTGGGVDVIYLNDLEERILAMMGGESFAIGDRHLEIDPFQTSHNPVIEAPLPDTHNQIIEATLPATSTLIEISAITEESYTNSDSIVLDHSVLSTARISPNVMAMVTPPAPSTPAPSPPPPSTPSGAGSHPPRRRINVTSRQSETRTQNRPPSRITTPSRPPYQRRQRLPPPSQRRTQFTQMSERFLAVEEQRLEVDNRHSLLLEALINNMRETNAANAEGLRAVGEGLKMLAEAIVRQ